MGRSGCTLNQIYLEFTVVVFLFFVFFSQPCHTAYRILVTRPGIKPGPSAVKVRSPNHWTAREVPNSSVLVSDWMWEMRGKVESGMTKISGRAARLVAGDAVF